MQPYSFFNVFQLLRSGKNPIAQIANGLGVQRKYSKPNFHTKGDTRACQEGLEEEVERFKSRGLPLNLELPATTLKRLVHVRRSGTQKALCHGVTITNK